MTIELGFFLLLIAWELGWIFVQLTRVLGCLQAKEAEAAEPAPPDAPTVAEVKSDAKPPIPPYRPRVGLVHSWDAQRAEYLSTGLWVRSGTPAWHAAFNAGHQVHVDGIPQEQGIDVSS